MSILLFFPKRPAAAPTVAGPALPGGLADKKTPPVTGQLVEQKSSPKPPASLPATLINNVGRGARGGSTPVLWDDPATSVPRTRENKSAEPIVQAPAQNKQAPLAPFVAYQIPVYSPLLLFTLAAPTPPKPAIIQGSRDVPSAPAVAADEATLTLSANANLLLSGGIDYASFLFLLSHPGFANDAQLGAENLLTVAAFAALAETALLDGVATQTISAHPAVVLTDSASLLTSLTIAAGAGETFAAKVDAAGTRTLAATAAETFAARVQAVGAQTLAAAAAETFQSALGASKTLTLNASAAETFQSALAGVATETMAAHAGETRNAMLAAVGARTLAAIASETFSNTLAGIAAETLAAHAAESFGAKIAAVGAQTLAATAAEVFQGARATFGALTMAAIAIDTFVASHGATSSETLAAAAGNSFASRNAAIASQALGAHAAEAFNALNAAVAAQSIAAHAAETFAAAHGAAGSTLLGATASETFTAGLDDFGALDVAAVASFADSASLSVDKGFTIPSIAALSESASLGVSKTIALGASGGVTLGDQLAAGAQNLLDALAGQSSTGLPGGTSNEYDAHAGIVEGSSLQAEVAYLLSTVADILSDAEVQHKVISISGGGGGGGRRPKKKWTDAFRYQDYDLADVAFAKDADVSIPATRLAKVMPMFSIAIARAEETLAPGRNIPTPDLVRSMNLERASLNERLNDNDLLAGRRGKFFRELHEWARHAILIEKVFAAAPFDKDAEGWNAILLTLEEQHREWARQTLAMKVPSVEYAPLTFGGLEEESVQAPAADRTTALAKIAHVGVGTGPSSRAPMFIGAALLGAAFFLAKKISKKSTKEEPSATRGPKRKRVKRAA